MNDVVNNAIKMYFNLSDDQVNLLTRQHKAILWFIFSHGSITPMDAFSKLMITKLSTRISELKVIGVQFEQNYETSVSEIGSKSHYMRYRKAAA